MKHIRNISMNIQLLKRQIRHRSMLLLIRLSAAALTAIQMLRMTLIGQLASFMLQQAILHITMILRAIQKLSRLLNHLRAVRITVHMVRLTGEIPQA